MFDAGRGAAHVARGAERGARRACAGVSLSLCGVNQFTKSRHENRSPSPRSREPDMWSPSRVGMIVDPASRGELWCLWFLAAVFGKILARGRGFSVAMRTDLEIAHRGARRGPSAGGDIRPTPRGQSQAPLSVSPPLLTGVIIPVVFQHVELLKDVTSPPLVHAGPAHALSKPPTANVPPTPGTLVAEALSTGCVILPPNLSFLSSCLLA